MTHIDINVVGCGRLGQAIAKLFAAAGLVKDIHVCNRTLASGERAVAAMGVGFAHAAISEIPASDLWLISCGDQEIESVAEQVAARGALGPDAVVFHCSGFLTSEVLSVLALKGARIASVHPIRSFADIEMSVRDFPGTFCGIEGEIAAQEILSDLFTKIGGRVFPLSKEGKVLCHAGHVFASNYLVALLDCAHRLYRAAAIPDDLAWRLMEPLVRGTVDNIMRLGPPNALTGPIARGEVEVVRHQLSAVAQESSEVGELYARLGLIATDVARSRGLSAESCETIRVVLAGW
jgi:predicted short-subunit dehydrogenase-like oxidoreductase (DUF2520 family)